MLARQELKRAAVEALGELSQRIAERQGGVATYHDNFLAGILRQLQATEEEHQWDVDNAGGRSAQLRWFAALIRRRLAGRFVGFDERSTATASGRVSEVGELELFMSQGVSACLSWRGRPLFKTVFDFALVPMLLWEVSPNTIFEIGSGTGTSAIWMADVLRTFARTPSIYSVDVRAPNLAHDGVTFLAGDCRSPASLFPAEVLRDAPHPWIVIEDAHVNVAEVLRHIDRYMRAGDYLFVEDSRGKVDDLRGLLSATDNSYSVDTRYTDFFGRNATCAPDSILVRTK